MPFLDMPMANTHQKKKITWQKKAHSEQMNKHNAKQQQQ